MPAFDDFEDENEHIRADHDQGCYQEYLCDGVWDDIEPYYDISNMSVEWAKKLFHALYGKGDFEGFDRRDEGSPLYHPHNQTKLTTDDMPDTPVNPAEFVDKVLSELTANGVFISDATPLVLEGICRLFNYSMIADKHLAKHIRSLVFPAQTGIGKSVSVQVYVSMLTEQSSLLVVSKVEEALQYCQYINRLKGSDDYARCFYTVTDKNKDHPLRIDAQQLPNVQCAVITHNMFRKVGASHVETFGQYHQKPRDFITIDEKLSFYEQYKISYNELDQIISNLDHILTHSPSLAPIQVCHQALNYLKQYKHYLVARDDKIITDSHSIVVRNTVDELQLYPILDALGEDLVYSLYSKNEPRKIIGLKNKQAVLDASPKIRINHQKRTIIGVSRRELWHDLDIELDIDDFYCKHFPKLAKCHHVQQFDAAVVKHLADGGKINTDFCISDDVEELSKDYDFRDDRVICFEILRLVFKARVDELFNELQQLGADKNPSYQRHTLDKVQAQLDALVYLNTNDFMIYKSNMGNSAFAVSNLVNQLGVSVVLDATASINQYYQLANRYLGHVAWVDAPQIRQYTNLTIHIATGFNQSRASLYKAQASKVDENAISYLSHAIAELQPDDKLLIICHLDFKKVLQKNCQDKRIQFTHWGNHVGRNLWSDCNKVMLIGWNYLNPLEYISMIASALDSVLLTTRHLNDELVNEFSLSQLADDIVQGLMRSQARIIATPDSDCRPTDFYLFHKGDEESQKVIDLVLSQFPQAKVEDWQPKGQAVAVKKRKPQKKIDSIIELLQEKAKSHQTYLLNDLVDELGINKSTMSRIVNSDEFAERLSEQSYLLKQKDGKSKQFILN
jgi:hypothetical protein